MPWKDGKWVNPLADPVVKLETRMIINQRDLDYRLEVMGMKTVYESDKEDNVDVTHSLRFAKYFPPETKLIQKALLRLELLNFRSYGTGSSNEAVVIETDHYIMYPGRPFIDYTVATGSHDHGGNTGIASSHTHTISPDGDHAHDLYQHEHSMTSPPHTHTLIHGIYEGPASSDITIKINGTDRTGELGGPFNANQDSIDITKYLTVTGWNEIELGSATLGRIHASLFVEYYLP